MSASERWRKIEASGSTPKPYACVMPDPSILKTWLVTGCSSGFGLRLVEAALAQGQRVVATARDLTNIRDLAGPNCTVLTLDVTEPRSIASAVRAAHAFLGRLDVVINNAGYGLLGAVEECTDDQVRRCMETNYFGPLAVIRAVLPHLRQQRSGHIVNVSAAAALANYAGFGVYGAAKAALELMNESLSAELRPLGIKVTLVQPGPFRTNFIARGLEKAAQPIDDYAASAGKFAGFLASIDGKQPGDPGTAAALIVRTVLAGETPLRLPLGKYMIKKMRAKAATLTREAEHWESAAGGTDFS
jgi:NAD(P)-dependent dehydrogenase (short-subunit alcohol dehydrogenase family)